MIVKCMLKNVRRNAGLGDPPMPYYNNIPESANALIKRAVGFKESEMTSFCKSMSTLVLQQKADVDSAVFNTGPYQLSADFLSFEVPQSRWFKMSTKQREGHLRKFRETRMTAVPNEEETSNGDPVEQKSGPPTNKLSVNLVHASIISAPEEILKSIARKAEELLNSPQSIVSSPGSTDNMSFIVESEMSSKPHFVSLAKNGKATCEDCPGWRSLKMCSHAVAAAEKSGRLLAYVKWLKEKGPSRINITSYVTCDSGNGTGKKGGKASTARRKGGRTGSRPPAKNIVDRPLPPTSEAFASIRSEALSQVTSSPTTVAFTSCTTVPLLQASTSILQPSSSSLQSSASHLQSYLPSVPLSRANVISPTPQNPTNGTFMFTLLQFCPSMVRSCFGCSQALKPGGTIAPPPFDLVITSRMHREFRLPTGELMHKEGNVYFHVSSDCVRRKQPYYDPRRTICPQWLVQHLTVEHRNLLQSFTQSF